MFYVLFFVHYKKEENNICISILEGKMLIFCVEPSIQCVVDRRQNT